MPLKLQLLSTQGIKWVSWCKTRLVALALMRKPGQIFKKTYALPSGIFAQIVLSDICDIIRIWGVGGFISHPRTILHPNGVKADGTDLSLLSDFPLVDDDHGSAIIDLEGKAEWTNAENYGNMVFVADDDVLSWRGPSGGYVLNNPAVNVVGFTKQLEDYELYTPLSQNLYQGGEAELLTGNVRCAAIIAGAPWVVIEAGGVDKLCSKATGEWAVVATRPAETYLGTAIPCIFQADKVVLQKGEWTFEGVWTDYAESLGTLLRGSGWDITETVSGLILHPGINASFNSTDKTVVEDSWDTTPGTVQAYIVSNGPVEIDGPTEPTGLVQYTVTGGQSPYIWTTSQGIIDVTGHIDFTNICGALTITVTDTCGDADTITATNPNLGDWVASVDYEQMHGQNPVGWTIDEWHTFGNMRMKLVSNSEQVGTYYFDLLDECGKPGPDPAGYDGWIDAAFFWHPDPTDWRGCGGKATGSWLCDPFTFLLTNQVCVGITDPVAQWDAIGPYHAVGGGFGGIGDYAWHGDTYHGIADGFAYFWQRQSRTSGIFGATCEMEVLEC